MRNYKPSAPRAAFAVAAIAMTAITIVALVIVPATLDSSVAQLGAFAQPSYVTSPTIVASNFIARSDALDVDIHVK